MSDKAQSETSSIIEFSVRLDGWCHARLADVDCCMALNDEQIKAMRKVYDLLCMTWHNATGELYEH